MRGQEASTSLTDSSMSASAGGRQIRELDMPELRTSRACLGASGEALALPWTPLCLYKKRDMRLERARVDSGWRHPVV